MSFVSTKFGQFRYFDQQLGRPEWRGKRVLDFGGSCGNLLADSRAAIDEDKYWCIDVSRDALAAGRKNFPKAHWTFYNRHSLQYNPDGIKNLSIPNTGEEFDFILAYSVFTHTSKAEMIDLVTQLRGVLADGGVLAFTFLDPQWKALEGDPFPGSNMRWRLEANKHDHPEIAVDSLDIDSLLAKARGAKWVTLVDYELYLDDEQPSEHSLAGQRAYIVLCDPEHMKTIFTEAEILPPAAPERQHCCIIRKI
ncbi:MAG TPA: class I SAM-dependent methyltransferase [Blastocatellia bacterium]|nr:class I SAM-dependent methyltransferase [Blastocatellia bacterium]